MRTGYWAFKKYQQDPYILDAQQDHLDQAIDWARQTGLKVWVDLHGAPRSQNGFDNSGQRVDTPGWTSDDSVAHTQDVIQMIATKYADPSYADVVVGIELLNEPLMANLPGGRGATQQYYQFGFDAVRGVAGSSAMVVIQDGFANPPTWNGFLTGEGTQGAVVDHHEYQVFTNDLVAMSAQQHLDYVCGSAQSWGTNQDKFVIVGEFTGALTDCAPALVSSSLLCSPSYTSHRKFRASHPSHTVTQPTAPFLSPPGAAFHSSAPIQPHHIIPYHNTQVTEKK